MKKSKKSPSVLIAAPTSNHKDYCFKEWVEMVRNIEYDNYDVFLVDNSQIIDHLETIWEQGIQADWMDRDNMHPVDFIAKCQNHIREKILKEGWDFLLMLETDVFMEKWMLGYMVAMRLPVLNIPYFLWEGEKTALSMQMARIDNGKKRAKMMPTDITYSIFDGTIRQMKEVIVDGETNIFATGVGCSLIHRSVLEKVTFRSDLKHDQKNTATRTFPDTFFHADVANMGNYIDLSNIVKHKRNTWMTL